MSPTPPDANFADRVRDNFARQSMMTTIGAHVVRVEPGEVEIHLPHGPHISQQHGFIHGGAIGMIADSACGYAALTLMKAGTDVVSSEYKINFLRPAVGQNFIATGRVQRAGKRVSVVSGEVHAVNDGKTTLIALILATMMNVEAES